MSAAPTPHGDRTTSSRARIAHRLQQAQGRLCTDALQRMDRDMAWFRELGAQERSWIGTVVQAGISAFVDWYRDPTSGASLRAEIFGQAPQAFAGQISLQRTVAMVRTSIEVVEENIDDVLGEADAASVLEAITRYGREVAFATAEIYARAAEQRGAWDARLEALVVDSVLRGETDGAVESRASALGWRPDSEVVVLVGPVPVEASPEGRDAVEAVRRIAHDHGSRALVAVQGERMVAIVGTTHDRPLPLDPVADAFGPGPVVVGPPVHQLADVPASAAAALAGYRAAPGWPAAPRPVGADDLLPERALNGDRTARARLVDDIHTPLAEHDVVLGTLRAYLDHGGSLERTARALFVHANTVRYRLRRVAELTHHSPGDPREAYTLRVALTLGDLPGNG